MNAQALPLAAVVLVGAAFVAVLSQRTNQAGPPSPTQASEGASTPSQIPAGEEIQGPPHSEIREIDRASDGVLWGVTRSALCRSADGGRTWTTVVSLDYAGGVEVQQDGSILVQAGAKTLKWLPDKETLDEWETFSDPLLQRFFAHGIWGLHGSIRRGDWRISYGATVHDPSQVPVGTHSTWVGSWLTGLVLASADAGTTWRVLDEWPGGRVEDAFLGEDGNLTTIRAGAGTRRGPLTEKAGQLIWNPEQFGPPSTGDGDPFLIEYAHALFFPGGSYGSVEGSGYEGRPDHRWFTEDGGHTWTLESGVDDQPLREYLRLRGGVYVAVERSIDQSVGDLGWMTSFRRWQDGAFHDLRSFAAPRSFASRLVTHPDSGGGLLVHRRHNGELLRLSPDGKQWELLRPAEEGR